MERSILGWITIAIISISLAGALLFWIQEDKPPMDLTLSDYPELFKKSVIIVIGENITHVESESAEAIAGDLYSSAGTRPVMKTDVELTGEDKAQYNFIVVGTPSTNHALEEMYELTPATRVTADYPGESRGIVELVKNPWNADKAMLLVEGSDEWGVKAASLLLNDRYRTYINGKSVVEVGYHDFYGADKLNLTLTDFSLFSAHARSYFNAKYRMSGADYRINYDLKEAPWLAENVPDSRLIQAYATVRQPDITETFIVCNGTTYVMPEDFNQFVIDAKVQLIDEDDALGLAEVYVKAWEPSGSEGIPAAVLLQSARDIPQLVRPVSHDVAQQITSPGITRQDTGFGVDLYSWCEVGGSVRAWDIVISQKGMITAESKVIGAYEGDCIIEV